MIMRAIKIIGHPIVVIGVFLFFIIEGDHFGGFYLLFLLFALPHGALYAITAVSGIASLIGGYQAKAIKWKQTLYVSGLILMTISLFTFFNKSDKTGVDATFRDTIPLLSFILLCLSVACFIARFFINGFKTYSKPG